MSAFTKSKLKAAKEALGKKDWQLAHDASLQVLDYEAENYHAYIFFGIASLELGQVEASEQAYEKAISINSEQLLAYQGLTKLYERSENWPKYAEALQKLIQVHAKANDASKCAEILQNLLQLRRERGSRSEVIETLSLLLPSSSLYSLLSTLPAPDPTNPTATATFDVQAAVHNSLPIIEEIVAFVEKDEEERVKSEIDKRRTRLGAAGPEQIKKDVGREVWGASRLPDLYNEILNHPNTSDELRRETESKLLRHKQRYLSALPVSGELAKEKSKVSAEVEELVNGIVLLGLPNELAWSYFIQEKDAETIDDYDIPTLNQYMKLFPESLTTRLLQGYFAWAGIPVPSDDDEDEEMKYVDLSHEESLDVILESFSSLQDSLLAHHVMAHVYATELEYRNAIEVAESGLELVRRVEVDIGKKLSRKKKAFNVTLATSLVHHFPPKHHPRAIPILDDVLSQDPNSVACLMGRGYVLQCADKWSDADTFFIKVAETIPDDLDDGLRAREESAWCKVQMNAFDDGLKALLSALEILDTLQGRDEDKARCCWRIGKCLWQMGDEKREESYRYFVTSLKRLSTFAPAFTSLGIYYAEQASPPDPSRAAKCFQKAFELDAREAEAARRLAESFADEREWDLVEVVAKRTIEGEGGLEGGMADGEKVTVGRYLPTNAWAWKAIGVVELNRRNYSPSIQAFQVALRANPDDQSSWVRLGEAYSKAGRHAAAVKALDRACELNPDDFVCRYLISDVQRQMGQYEEAIDSFETTLEHADPMLQLGTLMSIAQTYLEFGLLETSTGFVSRAESSFLSSINASLTMIHANAGHRSLAWKNIGDALFHLSTQTSFTDDDRVGDTLVQLARLISISSDDTLSKVISLPLAPPEIPSGRTALEFSVAAYSYRLTLNSQESKVTGSAWFDFAVALQSLARAHLRSEALELAVSRAVESVKEALRLEHDNGSYWNALGNMNFLRHPKISQHAFIKSLEINSKDVTTWTNLGLLYLHHGDAPLANEAFYRAQTLDPDYTVPWIGQGLVADANEHHYEATALFEHAVNLSAAVPEADLEFATRMFSRISGLSSGVDRLKLASDAMLPAFFVLDRYCKRRPEDATALHLFGLICEHIEQKELGIDLVERAITVLQNAYEETEDPVVERQFIIANITLGRLRLATGDYQSAIDAFETAKGLLLEDDGKEQMQILQIQAHFGSGLAHFHLQEVEQAMELLETALQYSNGHGTIKGHMVVLIAQILWALGTEESRETAKSRLLECIAEDLENLNVISVLAGMGILTEDDSLVDAALSEILSAPLDKRIELDPSRDITYVLTQHHLGQGDGSDAKSVVQRAMFAEPSRLDSRQEVASLTLQEGQDTAALALLVDWEQQPSLSDLRKVLSLRAIAQARAHPENALVAQKTAEKAIMLTPWDERNWRTLAYVRSKTAGRDS